MTSSSVLDNLKKIKSVDRNGMCNIQIQLPENCGDAVNRAEKLRIPHRLEISNKIRIIYGKPERVLVVGMGGSAIGGDLLRSWLSDVSPIPIDVSRDYKLPGYADEKTLVFVVSYSGNTEETLSSFVEAVERRCMVVAISSGGQLLRFCKQTGIPLVKLPSGIPPRTAVPYLFFPLIVVLKKMKILDGRNVDVNEAIIILKKVREQIKPETPSSRNIAKQVALRVKGTIPIIYGFRHYSGVAARIKTQFNENSKVPAKCEVFPELNHNEIVGWQGPEKLTKIFSVILLRDLDEPLEIKVRIDLTKKLVLTKKASRVLELYGQGRFTLARMLSVMYIGDFASVYLAILNNIDPTPVDIITKMKSELEERVDIAGEVKRRLGRITHNL